MIDKLIFQELTDAEAANLTGGALMILTSTPDGEGGFFGTLTPDNGVTVLEFEAEAPEVEDEIAAPAPVTAV